MRVPELSPGLVVLVGKPVFDAARPALEKAGLAVAEAAVPFPSPGHEPDFRRELRAALVRTGLERLIRPLPPTARARE